MTVCDSMKRAVGKRIDEGKNIQEIGAELCSGIKYPERKIIRIIREAFGDPFIIERAEPLGYNGVKQLLARKKKEVQNLALEKVEEVEEEKEKNGGLFIPYGIYYFSQDGCGNCRPETEVRRIIEDWLGIAGETMPPLRYINLSHEENDTHIQVYNTPTLIESRPGGLFTGSSSLIIEPWGEWHFGAEEFKKIEEKWLENGRKKDKEKHNITMEEIRKLVGEGKKFRELVGMGYEKKDVKTCLDEVKSERKKGKSNEPIDVKESKESCEAGVCSVE